MPTDGWHDINVGMPSFELSSWEVDTQTAADIAALMAVGRRDQIEFVSDGRC